MNKKNDCLNVVDLFNLQAIEVLERAGINNPSERQITTIERLLKS